MELARESPSSQLPRLVLFGDPAGHTQDGVSHASMAVTCGYVTVTTFPNVLSVLGVSVTVFYLHDRQKPES